MATSGLGPQPNPQPITLQPDVQLAPADTQLLTDHLLAQAAMNHPHSFAVKGEAVFIFRHCLGRKLPSDTGSYSTRTESIVLCPRSDHPGGGNWNHRYEFI